MSQHIINCPKCNKRHEVDAFRSGGIARSIVSSTGCGLHTDNPSQIIKLLGLEELHNQRIINCEMPANDE